MRKWIVGGIVYVAVLVAWQLYLEYDTKQFIDNLPQPPPQVLPQSNDLPRQPVLKSGVELEHPPAAEVGTDSLVSPFNSSDSSKGFVEADVSTHEDMFSTVEVPAKQNDNQLSVELEELFFRYYVLDEERRSIVKILEPMHEEHVAIINRHHEISHVLSSGPDPETQRALNKEREALLTKERELQPRIFEVQDEKGSVVEQLEFLVQEYGFSSWEVFREEHMEHYKAWRTSQLYLDTKTP